MPARRKKKAPKKTAKVRRNKLGQFPPGVSGNPAGKKPGTRHGLTHLLESINRIEDETGINLLDEIVKRSLKNAFLASKLLDKLVASPKSIELIDGDAAKKTRKVTFRKIADE